MTGQGVAGITCPYNGLYGPALAAIAPNPQIANWSASTWYYYNLNYVGLPLGKSWYDSMVVDLVKRTGRGLTSDLNYTLSRQLRDTYTAEQEYNGYYTPVQDIGNLAQAARTLSGYDQKSIVKGFALYPLPFGQGQYWLSGRNRILNGIVGGWVLGGLVSYASGQPFAADVNNIYYPLRGNFYPNFNFAGFTGHGNSKVYQAPTLSNPNPPATFYFWPNIASSPIPSNPATALVELGKGPAVSPALRCPGIPNEDASLLKDFSMGKEGQYKLQFRTEFYNVFNRHTYLIYGCGGVGSQIGAGNFAQVDGVNDNPRTGQFAVRFTF